MIEIDAIGAPAFVVDVLAGGGFRYASVNAAALARGGLAPGDPVGRSPGEVHAPPLASRLCRAWRDCVVKRGLVEYDVYGGGPVGDRPDGTAAWRTWLTPLFGADGAVTGLLGISHSLGEAQAERARHHDLGEAQAERARHNDLDEADAERARHHDLDEADAEHDWRAEAGRLAAALQSLNGAEWHRDGVDGPIRASDGFALLMGEAAPRPVAWGEWRDRVHPEDRDAVFGDRGGGVRRYRFAGRDGSTRWARCTRVAARDGEGRIVGLSGAVVDVTDEHDREERLRDLATHDALTGLLNRRGLRQALHGAASAWRADAAVALLMVDLDDFKATNDTFGHAAGDAALAEAARRLAAALGEGALCSRLGGDEFVAVRAVADRAEAQRLAEAVAIALSAPVSPSGPPLSASVGLSIGCGAPDFPSLMAAADAQLYARKAARKPARPGAARAA